MDRTLPRFGRQIAAALAILFCALALYGCWSTPGLVEHWGLSAAGVATCLLWVVVAAFAVSTAMRDPGRIGWAAFGIVAIGLRLVSLALVAGRTSPGDPHWYLELARHLLAGQGLFIDDPQMGSRAYAEFPPAYPLLLAGWGAVAGLSSLSVLTLSTLLDLGAAAMIARLGTRFGAARGRAAATLYLIWPSVLLDAPLAQKESLELVAILALAHGWLNANETGWRSALAIGIAGGAASAHPARYDATRGAVRARARGTAWLASACGHRRRCGAGRGGGDAAVVGPQLAAVPRLCPAHQRRRIVAVDRREPGCDRQLDTLSVRAGRLAGACLLARGGTAGVGVDDAPSDRRCAPRRHQVRARDGRRPGGAHAAGCDAPSAGNRRHGGAAAADARVAVAAAGARVE